MDEKDKIIAEQAEEIRILKELVKALSAKVEELTARLNKNSKNSGKPPSTDGLKKGTVKNSRIPSGKKSGGQQGHEGSTKELNPSPETIVKLNPKTECDCGGEVIAETEGFTIRQVIDMQPAKVITVEYRSHSGICTKCGKVHKGSFPDGVNGTVSYGDNLRAMVTYLNVYQLIPLKRATELISDLFGIKISEGTIVASGQEAYEKLAISEDCTKKELINSEVVHFDESGMRVGGKTYWMHSAGTDTSTVYQIHKNRGVKAMDAMGILPSFSGTAIHDHWKSYYQYKWCAHGECNEHHLRTLKYLHEDLKQAWAGEMVCLLLRIKSHVDISKCFDVSSLDQETINTYEQAYREILADAALEPEPPKEATRMANRLLEYEQETLLFMLDFNIPFTNNLAERDIRMPKAKQKISGGFRSEEGANAFARIRGFVSTVKKRGKNVFDGLVSVFNGNAQDFLWSDSIKN